MNVTRVTGNDLLGYKPLWQRPGRTEKKALANIWLRQYLSWQAERRFELLGLDILRHLATPVLLIFLNLAAATMQR